MPPKSAATAAAEPTVTAAAVEEGATIARVTQVLGRTGSRGNVTQVSLLAVDRKEGVFRLELSS